jgi:hypothetical protein
MHQEESVFGGDTAETGTCQDRLSDYKLEVVDLKQLTNQQAA